MARPLRMEYEGAVSHVTACDSKARNAGVYLMKRYSGVSNKEIGSTAVLLLKERMENPQKPGSKVMIAGELVDRQSVR